jgi:hypothetical protein
VDTHQQQASGTRVPFEDLMGHAPHRTADGVGVEHDTRARPGRAREGRASRWHCSTFLASPDQA